MTEIPILEEVDSDFNSPFSGSSPSTQGMLLKVPELLYEQPYQDAFLLWEKDSLFSSFLEKEFDEAEFLQNAFSLISSTFSERSTVDGIEPQLLETLQSALVMVEEHLKYHIVGNMDELLEYSNKLGNVREEYGVLEERISSVSVEMERVYSSINDPVSRLEKLVGRLEEVQYKVIFSRKVYKFIQLSNKIKHTLSNAEEHEIHLPKLAKIVWEASIISSSFPELDMLSAYRHNLSVAFDYILNRTQKDLSVAMIQLDQAEIGKCLQVFSNLGELEVQVKSVMDDVFQEVKEKIKESVDVSRFKEKPRSALWMSMEGLSVHVMSLTLRVWSLERVLKKKMDPLTGSLRSFREGAPKLLHSFWDKFVHELTFQLSEGVKASEFLKKVFLNEFPRLMALLCDLFDRLKVHVSEEEALALDGMTNAQRERLLGSVELLKEDFYTEIHDKFNSPVKLMFPEDTALKSQSARLASVPTMSDLSTFITSLVETLEDVRKAPELHVQVLEEIRSSIDLYVDKASKFGILIRAEGLASRGTKSYTDEKSGSLKSHESLSMLFNGFVLLDSIVRSIDQGVSVVMKGYDISTIKKVGFVKTREDIREKCLEILDPFISASKKEILKAFHGLHEDPVWESAIDIEQRSKFVKKVSEELGFLRRHLLAKFNWKSEVLNAVILNYCDNILTYLLYNISLIPNISLQGEKQLLGDIDHIREAISKFLNLPQNNYDMFKNIDIFKTILSMDHEKLHISGIKLCDSNFTRILLFQLLISRCKVLPSPCSVVGWKAAKFGVWECMHSENEIIDLLKNRVLVEYKQVKESQAADIVSILDTVL